MRRCGPKPFAFENANSANWLMVLGKHAENRSIRLDRTKGMVFLAGVVFHSAHMCDIIAGLYYSAQDLGSRRLQGRSDLYWLLHLLKLCGDFRSLRGGKG